MKLFHLVVSKASPFVSLHLFQPSAVPFLLLLSRLFRIYPSYLCTEGTSQTGVFLLHLVVYVVHSQSSVISFPFSVV